MYKMKKGRREVRDVVVSFFIRRDIRRRLAGLGRHFRNVHGMILTYRRKLI